MTASQLTLEQVRVIATDELRQVLRPLPKAKPKDWMLADTYDEAKEIYREKNGHYPIGFTMLAYFEKHPDEAEKHQLRKMRRSR